MLQYLRSRASSIRIYASTSRQSMRYPEKSGDTRTKAFSIQKKVCCIHKRVLRVWTYAWVIKNERLSGVRHKK
jgi:hypothetical protein